MTIDNPPVQETFGARIRRLMDTHGMSQTQLAEKSGIDRSVLNCVCRRIVITQIAAS